MPGLLRLPVGIENFAEIIEDGYYYVDKTSLIEQILDDGAKVSLFTRPRRFGKSLNMSMLKYFFETGTDCSLFDGLYISKNEDICGRYMGGFPVISISLKEVNANDFENAKAQVVKIINKEARRFQFLLESKQITKYDKKVLERLLSERMNESTITNSLLEISELLEKHYGKKVVVLIDEYDVPLAKANDNGYYKEMVLLIRNMFGNVLKTNDSLKFAVLTGCLRVAKESIFTGLNNFKVYSITDENFDETFGFTDDEVKEMLDYYKQNEFYESVKEWYNGYEFGDTSVYCPWDVVNFCADHLKKKKIPPKNYWINTSGNEAIKHFIDLVGEKQGLTKTELQMLINGEIIQKEINEDITYDELYSSADNLWSTLFMTGYLTKRGEAACKRYNLVIPNREIRNIMTEHILTLFKEDVRKDGRMVNDFCNALSLGEAEKVEKIFTEYMKKTISVRDTFVRKKLKENFYHGILLGILSFKSGWSVWSNRESGDGFSDIMIITDDENIGIVIEIKYAQKGKEENECQKAIQQILDKNYTETLENAGIKTILKYGIACNIKSCKVMVQKVVLEDR